VSVSEPPAPNGPETDDESVALDVEVVEEVRLPPVVAAPVAPSPLARNAPPRPQMRSAPPRPSSRSDRSDPASLPIAAMPIIQLGAPTRDGDSAVEVASTGVRRSSLPPAPGEHTTFSGIEEEVTPLRTRPPADSLVQAIPSPRPPQQSDPNVERPPYGKQPAPAPKPTAENGSAAARTAVEPIIEPETLPDEVVDSERLDTHDELDGHAEEIEPEPESAPQADALAPAEAEEDASEVETEVETDVETDQALEGSQESPENRISEPPPEVDPEDVEIHDTQTHARGTTPSQGKPPPMRLPLPLYARGAELAAAVQAQQAETPAGKRARYWWDELFGDDFLRTMDRLTDSQVKSEVNFIEDSLGVQKGGIILDLACGGGRHAVELGLRGYNVVGYDLSLAMLARAADEAQDKNQKLNFLHGDMRDMGFEEMFDGVYCWSTSFGYFDDEKNQLVAQKIHRALRSGGMLLLDVANRDFVTQRQPSLVWFEGDGCVCMDEMRVDFITSRLRVKRMVILDDGRTRELDYSIRLYTLHELGRMLHDVGFKVTEVSGHPATPGVFMGADSPRLIVLAEKS
jgi:SAM-dependent methyltransferase